jgi:hypothetical protein
MDETGADMTSSEPDTGEAVHTDALDRAQEAIDEGNEAAKKALDGDHLGDELDVPATGDGLESDEQEVAPRPI